MATSSEIKQRANALAEKTDVNSITPKEVGGIMYDLASHSENVLRNGGTLGIRKVYESVAAMEADSTNPKDFWGDPLKKGNLVVIYDGTSTGVDNNKIYAFLKPGWQIATHLDAEYATKASLDAAIENILLRFKDSENALNESIGNLEETVNGNKQEVEILTAPLTLTKVYTEGQVVNYAGVTANAEGAMTDYIQVNSGTQYKAYVGGSVDGGAIVYYDKNKQYVEWSSMSASEKTLNIPSNAIYVRLSLVLANIGGCYLKDLDNNNIWLPYKYIDKSIVTKTEFAESQKETKELLQSFDKVSNYESGKAVNYTGVIDSETGCVTDYIKVSPNTEYVRYTGSAVVDAGATVYYDKDKNFVDWGSMTVSPLSFTTKENVEYIRMTIYMPDVLDCYLKTGDDYVWTPTKYIEKDVVRTQEFEVVKKDVEHLNTMVDGNFELTKNYKSNTAVNYTGEISSEFGAVTDFVAVEPNTQYQIFCGGVLVDYSSIVYYDKDKKFFDWTSITVTERTLNIPEGVHYLKATIYEPNADSCYIKKGAEYIWKPFKYSVVTNGGSENAGGALPLEGKTIVCIGDSITEFSDGEGRKYADYIAEYSGATVVNIGIGGTQINQRTTPVLNPTSSYEAYAALDVVNMIKTIASDKGSTLWSQIANAFEYVKNNAGDNNDAIYQRMLGIDWSKVDAVTIFAGTNDWASGRSIGVSGSEDPQYTLGAINVIVESLLTKYPHISLYWFTPIIRWKVSNVSERTDETFSDSMKNDANMTLKEFAQKIYDEVKLNHIPVCDMYNTLGWNKYNFSQYFADNDGTHPKDNKPIARKMVAFIESNRNF